MVTDIIVIILLTVILIFIGWKMFWLPNDGNSSGQELQQRNYQPPNQSRQMYYQPSKPIMKKKVKKPMKHVEFEEDARSLGAMEDTLSDIGSVGA